MCDHTEDTGWEVTGMRGEGGKAGGRGREGRREREGGQGLLNVTLYIGHWMGYVRKERREGRERANPLHREHWGYECAGGVGVKEERGEEGG